MAAIVGGNNLGLSHGSMTTLGMAGQTGSASIGQVGEQAYVNASTGNLVLRHRDEFLAATGIDVEVARTYNSRGRLDDDNGDNWQIGLYRSLAGLSGTVNTANSSIARIAGDGAIVTYRYDTATARYIASDTGTATDTLTFDSSSAHWTWTSGNSRITEIYDGKQGGRLVAAFDTDGNRQDFSYDESGLLNTVVNASGETVTFRYHGKNLAGIDVRFTPAATAADPVPTARWMSRVRYEYDTDNRLVRVVTDLSPEDNSISDGNIFWTQFAYEGNSKRISRVLQQDGTTLDVTYQLINGDWRVDSTTDALSRRTTYSYFTEGDVRTEVRDPTGGQAIYRYDSQGRWTSITQRDSRTGNLSFNSYTYDDNGNVITVTDGANNTTIYRYDANNNRIYERNAEGGVITRVFGSSNQILSETRYARSIHDGDGNLAASDPAVTRFIYDSENHLRFTVSPEGRLTELRYDARGLRTSEIRYAFPPPTSSGWISAMVTEADLAAWIAKLSASDQRSAQRTDYTYDARGLLAQSIEYANVDSNTAGIRDGDESRIRYVHDQSGLLLQRIDARQTMTSFIYDGMGRQLAEVRGATSAPAKRQAAFPQFLTLPSIPQPQGLRFTMSDFMVRFNSNQISYKAIAEDLPTNSVIDYWAGPDGNLQRIVTPSHIASTPPPIDGKMHVVRVITGPAAVQAVYMLGNLGLSSDQIELTPFDRTTFQQELVVPTASSNWKASANVATGAVLKNAAGGLYRVLVGGTTDSTEPTGTYIGGTFWHGSTLLEYVGAAQFSGTLKASRNGGINWYLGNLAAGDLAASMPEVAKNHLLSAIKNLVRDWVQGRSQVVGSRVGGVATGGMIWECITAGVTSAHSAFPTDATVGTVITEASGVSWRATGKVQGSANWYLSDTDPSMTAAKAPDSHDSYAATLVWAIQQYVAATGDTQWLTEASTHQGYSNADVLMEVLYANILTQFDAGLVRTFQGDQSPSGGQFAGRYLMDNVETWAGLNAGAQLMARLGKPDLANYLTAFRDSNLAGIESLWQEGAGAYRYSSGVDMTSPAAANSFYPHASSQYWALRFGVPLNSTRLRQATAYADGLSKDWPQRTDTSEFANLGTYYGRYLQGKTDELSTVLNLAAARHLRKAPAGEILPLSFNVADAALYLELRQKEAALAPPAPAPLQYVSRRLFENGARYRTVGGIQQLTTQQQVVREDGSLSVATYNTAGQLISTAEYDTRNTLVGDILYSYDPAGHPRMVQDAVGNRTYQFFDAAGQKIAEVDGDGSLIEYRYNRAGQLTQLVRHSTMLVNTDLSLATLTVDRLPLGNHAGDEIEYYEYDAAGRLIKTLNGAGYLTENRYDGMGRVYATLRFANRQAVLPNGQLPAPDFDPLVDRVARTFYDRDGLISAQMDGDGYLTEYRRDGIGQILSKIHYATPASPTQRSNIEYSMPAVSSTSADTLEHRIYDGKGQLKGIVDAENLLTEFVYNANDQLITKIRYAATITYIAGSRLSDLRPIAGDHQRVSFEYDARGLLTRETASDGTVTQHTYDLAGKLLNTVRAFGTVEARAQLRRVDSRGLVTAELSGEGAQALAQVAIGDTAAIESIWQRYAIRYRYDAAGQRLSMTDANGLRTVYYYDADGRLAAQIDAAGEVLRNTYDAMNRLREKRAIARRLDAAALAGLNGGQFDATFSAILDKLQSGSDNALTYDYDARGLVIQQTDALGFATATEFNAFGELALRTTQIDKLGRSSRDKFEYDHRGNLRAQTADFGGASSSTQTVTYDAFGRVERRIDARGNATVYSYDRNGRQVSVKLPLQDAITTTYDAYDRVVATTDANGTTTREYNAAQRSYTVVTPEGIRQTVVNNRHGQQITVIDGKNISTTYEYDRDGRLLRTIDGEGHKVEASYDVGGRLETSTDANGVVTQFSYDIASRILRKTVDPLGLNLTTSFTYDAQGRVATETDARGVVTRKVYDASGQLKTITVDADGDDALKLVTTFDYDGRGNVLKVTTPTGLVTEYQYDNQGRRISETSDPQGAALRTEYYYDEQGNLVGKRNPNQTKAAGAYQNDLKLTSYVYDAQNRLSVVIDAEGSVVRYEYDNAGRISTTRHHAAMLDMAAELASLQSNATRSVASDGVALANRVLASHPHDQVERKIYDKDGRTRMLIDGAGGVTSFTYDKNGNVVERIAYSNKLNLASVGAASTTEELTKLLADHESDQRVITAYDKANRAISTATSHRKLADGRREWAITEVRYDANGNLLLRRSLADLLIAAAPTSTEVTGWAAAAGHINSSDLLQRYAYDAANRRTAEAVVIGQDAQGVTQWAITQSAYDNMGQLARRAEFAVTKSPPTGTPIDAEWRTWLLMAPTESPADRVTRYGYDDAGRRTAIVDATGAVTRMEYDRAGRLLASTRHYEIPTGITSAQTAAEIAALVRNDAARDRAERHEYDAAGRLRFTRDAGGYLREWRYDGLGNALDARAYQSPVFGNGKLSDLVSQAGIVRKSSFSYDANGRMLSSTDALGAIERFSYDGAGNKKNFTNKVGDTWDYRYDGAGRLLAEQAPLIDIYYTDGSKVGLRPETAFEYDAIGNLTARIEAANVDTQARRTEYKYDAAGRQVMTVLPKASSYNASFDQLVSNGVAQRVEKDEAASITVEYDTFGRAVRNTDAVGNVSEKSYDQMGRVVAERDGNRYITLYQRDSFGNVLALTRQATAYSGALAHAARLNVSVTDRTIRTEYDILGRAVLTREPAVQLYDHQKGATVASIFTGVRTTETRYNAFGEVIQTEVYAAAPGEGRPQRLTKGLLTSFFHDQRGALKGQLVAADADMPTNGYLTTREYDAAGNMLRQVEFKQIVSWSASSQLIAGIEDREVRYTYDSENHKLAEIRANVRLATGAAGADLQTTYTYDALGRITSATDALGNTNYTYYNKLGHTIAVAGPNSERRTMVAALFLALADRAPDANELQTWTARIGSSGAVQVARELIAAFPSSAANDTEFVNQLYQRALNREPDTEGAAFWTATLAKLDRAEMVLSFLNAQFNYAGGNQAGYDSQQFFNSRLRAALAGLVANESAARAHGGLATLSELHLDAHGKTVQRIERANGALYTTASGYSAVEPNAALDRITRTEYDGAGNAIKVVNAANHSTYSSYDKAGRLAKQWTPVRDGIDRDKWSTAYLVMKYDGAGQAIETIEPGTTGDSGPIRRTTTFNAFGEVVMRKIGDRTVERNDYNNAGQLWRSNAGDGVARVVLTDARGNATLQLRSATEDLMASTFGDAATAASLAKLERVETRYDVLGHVTSQVRPAPAAGNLDNRTTVMETLSLTIKVHERTSDNVIEPEYPGDWQNDGAPSRQQPRFNGFNRVELKIPGLKGLGNGDVKVEFRYSTGSKLPYSGELSHTQVFGAAEMMQSDSVTLNWSDKPSLDRIRDVIVSKKNAYGEWVEISNTSASGPVSDILRIPAPDNPATLVVLQYRQANGVWQTAAPLVNFGDTWRFDTQRLPDGNYEYRVQHVGIDGKAVDYETGSMTVASAALRTEVVQLFVAILDRAPDAAGLQYWVNTRKSGLSLEQLANKLLESDEGKIRHPSLSATATQKEVDDATKKFVRDIVGSAFGLSDIDGDWVNRLKQGAPRSTIVNELIRYVLNEVSYSAVDDANSYFTPAQRMLADKTRVALHYVQLKGNTTSLAGAELAELARLSEVASKAILVAKVEDERNQIMLAQLYIALYGRAPDKTGLLFWSRAMKDGEALRSIANSLLMEPEGQRLFADVTDSDAFIQRIYSNLFGHGAEQEELNRMREKVATNGRADAVVALLESIVGLEAPQGNDLAKQRMLSNKVAIGLHYALRLNGNDIGVATALMANVKAEADAKAAAVAASERADAENKAAQVALAAAAAAAAASTAANAALPLERKRTLIAQLYVALLGRAPDLTGISFWAPQISADLSVHTIAQAILMSAEGKTVYAEGLSKGDFIDRLYRVAFQREPDATGKNFWLQQLDAGRPRGAVAAEIVAALVGKQSPVDEERQAQRLFNNRVAVGLAYAVDMGGDNVTDARAIDALVTSDDTTAANRAMDQALRNALLNANDTAIAAERAKAVADAAVALRLAAAETAAADAQASTPLARSLMRYAQVYIALMGTEPNFATLDAAGVRLQADPSLLHELTQELIIGSPLANISDNRAFITAFYAQGLRQPADSTGISYWTDGLDRQMPRGRIIVDMVNDLMTSTKAVESALAARAVLAERAAGSLSTALASAQVLLAKREAEATLAAVKAKDARNAADEAQLAAQAVTGTISQTAAQNRLDILRMYVAILHRAPSLQELADGLTALSSGIALGKLADSLLSLPPASTNLSANLSATEFVTEFYRTTLGRAVDSDGLTFWTKVLNDNNSRGTVLSMIIRAVVDEDKPHSEAMAARVRFDAKVFTAAEQLTNAARDAAAESARIEKQTSIEEALAKAARQAAVDAKDDAIAKHSKLSNDFELLKSVANERHMQVIRLSLAMLNRAPALDELRAWVALPTEGFPLSLVNILLTKQEWISTFSGTTDDAFLSGLYLRVLNRAPDSGGLTFWQDSLGKYGYSRQQIVIEFIKSLVEYRGIGDLNISDQHQFNQRVTETASNVSKDAAASAGKAADDAKSAADAAGDAQTRATEAKNRAEKAAKDALAAAGELSALNTPDARARLGVMRLSLAILGRAPTLLEMREWLTTLSADPTITELDALATTLASKPEWNATYGGLSDGKFIDTLYQNVLKRAPDPQGRSYWLDALAAFNMADPRANGRPTIVSRIVDNIVSYKGVDELAIGSQKQFDERVSIAMASFANTAEQAITEAIRLAELASGDYELKKGILDRASTAYNEAKGLAEEAKSKAVATKATLESSFPSTFVRMQVIQLYAALFRSAPSISDLNEGVRFLGTKSLTDLAQVLLDSTNGRARFNPSLSNADFLNALYVSMLDRNADAVGRDWWLSTWGARSKAQRVVDFVDDVMKYDSGRVGQAKTDQITFLTLLKGTVDSASSAAQIAFGTAQTERDRAFKAWDALRVPAELAADQYKKKELLAVDALRAANSVYGSASAAAIDRLKLTRLYVAVLNRHPETRNPDLNGFDYWLNQIPGNTQRYGEEKAWLMLVSGLLTDSNGGASTRYPANQSPTDLITTFYVTVLGRQPDPDGLSYWLNALDKYPDSKRERFFLDIVKEVIGYGDAPPKQLPAGTASRKLFEGRVAGALQALAVEADAVNTRKAQTARDLGDAADSLRRTVKSWEDQARAAEIEASNYTRTMGNTAPNFDAGVALENVQSTWVKTIQLYKALLERTPDNDALKNAYTTGLTNNMTAFAESILNGWEAKEHGYLPNMSNEAFVANFYAKALNSSDPGDWWAKKINAGEYTRAGVVARVLEQVYYSTDTSGPIVAQRTYLQRLVNDSLQEVRNRVTSLKQPYLDAKRLQDEWKVIANTCWNNYARENAKLPEADRLAKLAADELAATNARLSALTKAAQVAKENKSAADARNEAALAKRTSDESASAYEQARKPFDAAESALASAKAAANATSAAITLRNSLEAAANAFNAASAALASKLDAEQLVAQADRTKADRVAEKTAAAAAALASSKAAETAREVAEAAAATADAELTSAAAKAAAKRSEELAMVAGAIAHTAEEREAAAVAGAAALRAAAAFAVASDAAADAAVKEDDAKKALVASDAAVTAAIRAAKKASEDADVRDELVVAKSGAAHASATATAFYASLFAKSLETLNANKTASELASRASESAASAARTATNAVVELARTMLAQANAPAEARNRLLVTQLYQGVLGRAIDIHGLVNAAAALKLGTGLADLATRMLDSPEGKGHFAQVSGTAEFINKVSIDLQGKAPSEQQRVKWDNFALGMTRGQLAAAIVTDIAGQRSLDPTEAEGLQNFHLRIANTIARMKDITSGSEADAEVRKMVNDAIIASMQKARDEAIAADKAATEAATAIPYGLVVRPLLEAYLAVLDRSPTTQEFHGAVKALRDGKTLPQLVQDLLNSDTGKARYPQGSTDSSFIESVYFNVLGRTPDAAGKDYWEKDLLRTRDRANTLLGMLSAVDDIHGGEATTHTSAHLFANRVTTALSALARDTGKGAQALLDAADLAKKTWGKSQELALATYPDALPANALLTPGIHGRTAPNAPATITVTQQSDRWGNVEWVTDPRNAAWRTGNSYNAYGQLLSSTQTVARDNETPAKAAVTSYTYNGAGQRIEVTDANGNSNRIEYDANGNATREVHADAGIVRHTYNAFGERTLQVQERGGGLGFLNTYYDYDALGQLEATRSGTVQFWSTDATRKEGFMYAAEVGEGQQTERYEYDQLGRRVAVINGLGQASRTAYDLAGNAVREEDGGGRATVRQFDSYRRKISETDANGKTMTWRYENGRLKGHTIVDEIEYSYEYNNLNQLVSETSTERKFDRATASGGTEEIKVAGKNRSYEYENGMLVKIIDLVPDPKGGPGATKVGQVTTYAYDAAGNRVRERSEALDDANGLATIVQDNRIKYDSQGRMTQVFDGHFNVEFGYDNNGNRTLVHTRYSNAKDNLVNIKAYNVYDAMNRQTVVNGASNDGGLTVIRDNESDRGNHIISYDKAGLRLSDTYRYKNNDGKYLDATETFIYDGAGRLSEVKRKEGGNEFVTDRRRYDAAGRVVFSGPGFNQDREKLAAMGVAAQTSTYAYDAGGQVYRVKYRDLSANVIDKDHFLDDIYYENKDGVSGYDQAGNVNFYTIVPRQRGPETRVTHQYAGKDTSMLATIKADRSDGKHEMTTQEFDQNGHLIKVTDSGKATATRTFINDANGIILRKTQDNVVTRNLVVNGEVLGASTAEIDATGMAYHYQSASTAATAGAQAVYRVQTGDTLESIARMHWGDSKLWYLIADANGVDNNDLIAGLQVRIPTRNNSIGNDANTFKPYNQAEMVGDTMPTLPAPPAKKGCGAVGHLIMAAVAIAVLVAAGPAVANSLASFAPTLFSAGTAATGGALAANSVATVVGGALTGAASSISSQVVGMAIGAQEKFSWKSVALSAVATGASAGVGELAKSSFLAGTSSGNVLASNDWYGAATRAMLSNTISQGIGIATNLQSGFKWQAVAAAGTGAAVGDYLSKELNLTDAAGRLIKQDFPDRLWKGAVSGFGAGTTAALMSGGKVVVTQVAADAFGNALGQSLAEQMRGDNQTDSQEKKLLTDKELRKILKDNGQTDYISKFSRAAFNRPAPGGDVAPGTDMNWSKALQEWRAKQPDSVLIPAVEVPGTKWDSLDHLAYAFKTTREAIAETMNMAGDGIYDSRINQARYYREAETDASNPVSRELWHLGGLASKAGHNAAAAGQGLYRIATDGDARAAAAAGLKHTWDNVPRIMARQANTFAAMTLREKSDALITFGLESATTWGAGKVAGATGNLVYSGGAKTLTWLAPKAGDLLENYMYRSGLLQYAVPPSEIRLSATQLRNTPGSVTISGDLAPVSGRWLDPGVATPIPAQVGNALVGKTFNTFDDLRAAIWEQIGNNSELTGGFSRSNLAQLNAGRAPFAAPEHLADSGVFGQRFNLHHHDPIFNGGSVYDLSNLRIVSPKVHSQIHYGP